MKYLDEYRNPEIAHQWSEKIHAITTRDWTLMELCGGQTHSIMKNGLMALLPPQIHIIHGPGCPVCVTPVGLIDVAIELALKHDVIVCSFGDMMRVPGTKISLLEAKSRGGHIQILYSPLEAVKLAQQNPDKQIVFFSVGFETTAPANALSVLQACQLGLKNYSILTAHVLVPPAIEAIMDDEKTKVNAFLAAGHVCTIMGYQEYYPLVEKYHTPIIVTGFEPMDLLQGIYMAVKQLESNKAEVENQYTRYVTEKGNQEAQNIIFEVFEIGNREWRGLGTIKNSGYSIREKYQAYDAIHKFEVKNFTGFENEFCIAGDILKGLKKPHECPQFGKGCTPEFPLGAPMVSTEGACSAYMNYGWEKSKD